ncbi:espin-like isoform X2 [Protopterus annectens]|nr:espin-like isoform X2 [Protopterus annectens]XP_043932981.1 espin-like isoform X2 [Protopterus annectens]
METGTTQNRKESVGSPCSNGPLPGCETIIIPIASLGNTIPLGNRKPNSVASPPLSPSDGVHASSDPFRGVPANSKHGTMHSSEQRVTSEPPSPTTSGQKRFNMTQPSLSSRQLLSELKAGINLRPIHQSTGVTTVFSGSGKNIRKLSVDRKSEDGSHRSTPSSPSDQLPIMNGEITEQKSSASEMEGR